MRAQNFSDSWWHIPCKCHAVEWGGRRMTNQVDRSKGQKVSQRTKWLFILVGSAILQFGMMSSAFAGPGFPQVKSVFDTDDILERYEVYLSFVTQIGRDVDRNNTQRLLKIYSSLKRRSPDHAATFLKGLRFEMISKADLMGADSDALTNRNPELRRWVGRYMKEWVREADEHLFRSFTNASLARKD
jgi:hypothetical protein